MMNIKLLSTIIISLLGVLFVEAQVTIGSGIEPRKGVLLDLKENDKLTFEDNANAGLGIPRVALVSPLDLTIDADSNKAKYVGATVYNVTENETLKKGPYTWNGDEWIRVITASVGTLGEVLYSEPDGTAIWRTPSLPIYPFYMPTTVSFFDSLKKNPNNYTYNELLSGSTVGGVSTVNIENSVDKRYAYIDKFYTNVTSNQEVHFKLFFTYEINLKTRNAYADLIKPVWFEYKVNVYIDDQLVVGEGDNRVLYSEFLLASSEYSCFSTMIKLPSMEKGSHSLKIDIVPLRHTFSTNVGAGDGNFDESEGNLLKINIVEYLLMAFEKE